MADIMGYGSEMVIINWKSFMVTWRIYIDNLILRRNAMVIIGTLTSIKLIFKIVKDITKKLHEITINALNEEKKIKRKKW